MVCLSFSLGTQLMVNPIPLKTAKTLYRVLAVLSAIGLRHIFEGKCLLFHFTFLLNGGQLLKERICFPEHVLSFNPITLRMAKTL